MGDAVERLRELPAGSVQMCVTSPPFYGLRDYGVEGQIGLEATPELWVARLVEVFREVRRVLRDDGVLWVEVGDSYTGPPRLRFGDQGKGLHRGDSEAHDALRARTSIPVGMKQKDLLGQPWMLAFALRADGWFLRSEVIWARPNPMPESVTDRPTKAHSTVFLLSKRARYFYDADAIREPSTGDQRPRNTNGQRERTDLVRGFDNRVTSPDRNARSVWSIPTQPLRDEHYAAFPEELARRCILAGSSEYGCCAGCGAPWVRVVDVKYVKSPVHGEGSTVRGRGEPVDVNGWAGEKMPRLNKEVHTVGWEPSCGCVGEGVKPCVVLDPFLGSGTSALVARKLGRECVGVELSPVYAEMALRRLRDPDALNRAALAADGPAQLALVEGDGTGG